MCKSHRHPGLLIIIIIIVIIVGRALFYLLTRRNGSRKVRDAHSKSCWKSYSVFYSLRSVTTRQGAARRGVERHGRKWNSGKDLKHNIVTVYIRRDSRNNIIYRCIYIYGFRSMPEGNVFFAFTYLYKRKVSAVI